MVMLFKNFVANFFFFQFYFYVHTLTTNEQNITRSIIFTNIFYIKIIETISIIVEYNTRTILIKILKHSRIIKILLCFFFSNLSLNNTLFRNYSSVFNRILHAAYNEQLQTIHNRVVLCFFIFHL